MQNCFKGVFKMFASNITLRKLRCLYILLFLLLFMIEVLIAVYVHDDFIRPYIGDFLVVILLYCFVRIFTLRKIKFLSVFVFLFAVATEFLQLIDIMSILGLGGNAFFSVIIGSTFDIRDVACYFFGCLLLYVIDIKNAKKDDKTC